MKQQHRTQHPAPAMKAAPPTSNAEQFVLQEKRWFIENQHNKSALRITPTAMYQTAYIGKCSGSVLEVTAKINGITVTECNNCTLIVDGDIVSMLELVRCSSMSLLVRGQCRTISIDSCSEIRVALSEQSKECEFHTFLSQHVSFSVPETGMREHRICDYWTSRFDPIAKTMATTPTESCGLN